MAREASRRRGHLSRDWTVRRFVGEGISRRETSQYQGLELLPGPSVVHEV